MGPPLDGGGRARRSERRREPAAGFNGAAARWRRKALSPAYFASGGIALQWGRRSMAAEGMWALDDHFNQGMLQWGRRSMAAEGVRGRV